MARKLREKSVDGFYYVKISRKNDEKIFFEDSDYEKITNILRETKEKYGFSLLAYSFVDVRMDMLLKTDDISALMKQFVFKCSRYLKNKYQKEENIFKKRYSCLPLKSGEIVENCVVIHNIPVSLHKCDENGDYKYSSFDSYFKTNEFADTAFVFSKISYDDFFRLHYTHTAKIPENENERIFKIKKDICLILGLADFREIKYIDRNMKKEAVVMLFRKKCCRVSDIAKVFNLSRQRVYTILKNSCGKTIDKI